MFSPLFHIRMKEQRVQRSLAQRHAAHVCGLTPKRWSNLERGYRRPTVAEFFRISRYLDLGDCFPIPSKAKKTLLDQGSSLTPVAAPYFAPKDRQSYIRYRHTCRRYTKLAQLLTQHIGTRDDFTICQYLCHQIASDSSLEILNILNLMGKGALPALVAPNSLAPTPRLIVDPSNRKPVGHRPQPCLIYGQAFHFYQVSFLTEYVRRVDVLQWNERWLVHEINGSGHDRSIDHLRETSLGIPIVWKTESDVVKEAEDFLEEKRI